MYGYDPTWNGEFKHVRAMLRMRVAAPKPKETDGVGVDVREIGTVASVLGTSYKVIAEPGTSVRHDGAVGSSDARTGAEHVLLWFRKGSPAWSGEDRAKKR